MNTLVKIFCAIAILSFNIACNDDILTSPSDVVFPEKNVSFKSHVKPFLNLSCAYQGCHAKESMAAGLALVDYNDLFFGASALGLVIEYKPESSRLYQIINGDLPHFDSFQDEINDNHRQGIKTWIKEGAKLN